MTALIALVIPAKTGTQLNQGLAPGFRRGDDFVPAFTNAANNLIAEIEQRNWL